MRYLASSRCHVVAFIASAYLLGALLGLFQRERVQSRFDDRAKSKDLGSVRADDMENNARGEYNNSKEDLEIGDRFQFLHWYELLNKCEPDDVEEILAEKGVARERFILASYGKVNPEGLIRLLDQRNYRNEQYYRQIALDEIAIENPQRALAVLGKWDAEGLDTAEYLVPLMSGWAARDVDDATLFLEQLGNKAAIEAYRIVLEQVRRNGGVVSVLAWIDGVSDAGTARRLFEDETENLVRDDPLRAMDAVLERQSWGISGEKIGAVVSSYALVDPQGSVEKAWQFKDGRVRNNAIMAASGMWSIIDPVGMSQWLAEREPSWERDVVQGEYASSIMRVQPERALEALDGIQTKHIREDYIEAGISIGLIDGGRKVLTELYTNNLLPPDFASEFEKQTTNGVAGNVRSSGVR